MQAPDRARHLDQHYQQRRGHLQQPSISDDNYHVTEAIGDMYDEPTPASPEYLRQNRPLSFVPSPLGETINTSNRFGTGSSPPRAYLQRQGSGERVPGINGIHNEARRAAMEGLEGIRHDGASSNSPPPRLNRQPSDTASQPFEMSLDYSKPEDVAQELSNLQAIRRMSMGLDVSSQDPDLPSFNPSFRVPSIAPSTHSADEDDPSRLFWVPARLHPELAPKEFKTFIEDKVKTIKRTSGGEESLLSADGLSRAGSGSSLRRKKSMLSRQIDSGNNYQDGADRLERQGSLHSGPETGVGLKELETLVTDPSIVAEKMSGEIQRESLDSGIGVSPATDDMPLFPQQGGPTLKRSTRTQYRKGSLRKGEKLPFSKRLAARQAGGPMSDGEDSPASSPNTDVPPVPNLPLTRVQTEPASPGSGPLIEKFDFSRPGRKRAPASSASGFLGELDFGDSAGGEDRPGWEPEYEDDQQQLPPQTDEPNGVRHFQSRIASNPRTTAATIGAVPVPQIVETPPPDPSYSQPVLHPERKSSRSPTSETPPSLPPQQPLPNRPRMQQPQQQLPRPSISRQAPQPQQQHGTNRTFDDMQMAGGYSRTENLSIIPTMPEDKKVEKKKSKEDSRKPSWNLFSSRGKEEERERKEEEAAKRAKAKSPRPGDESGSGRLDVLQQQIDGVKPRESLVLDRSSIRLEEERKKESNRKSHESNKKEKDGLFSSLFSSKKKDKDSTGKHAKQRGLSPEPPMRILKADVDYNWTRFSIMEERAIYRMAHIKLANPRRELYSQVLLSNFMYSYLAKVQSQHPQLQVTADPRKQQRGGMKKEPQQRQQSNQQPDEFSQYQRYQQQQQQQSQQHQQSHQAPSQYQADQQEEQDSIEDGPMEPQPDPRASQHTQYSNHQSQSQPQQQYQHQQYQGYVSQNGGYGNGYGGSNGGGGAPVVSSTHGQGEPINHLGSHGTQRNEPLTSHQGDMW